MLEIARTPLKKYVQAANQSSPATYDGSYPNNVRQELPIFDKRPELNSELGQFS